SISECAQRVNAMNCDAMCGERVSAMVRMLNGNTWGVDDYRGKNRRELNKECLSTCRQSKDNGLEAALRYYNTELPQRVANEKRTLAQLTGWSMHDIDAIPGARRYAVVDTGKSSETATAGPSWWQKLFGSE